MTDRQLASVGVNVDLVANPDRRLNWIGVNVDYVLSSFVQYPVTVSTTQAQVPTLTRTFIAGGPVVVPLTVQTTQAQIATRSFLPLVIRHIAVNATQAQAVSLTFSLVVALTIRRVSSVITFAGVALTDVISARGQVAADSGWPTCSVLVTAKPSVGNEEDDLEVVAGAGNNVTRFTGKLRRFRPSAFPKSIEMVGMGTLAYAAEWAPDADLIFDEEFPTGATDQALVVWALGFVPGVSYVGANIEGTGITLGTEAPEAFDWKAGMSAWQYVQRLDQATLYRTYQAADGTIYRTQMIGHPSSLTTSFTLANHDILEGSTGERNTEQTRNAAIVRGHDYGDGTGPVLGMAYGSNDFQSDGSVAATRHAEAFSSDLIEDGSDEDGTPLGNAGIDAQDIADAILNDVNKEFVAAQIRSWRDDTHGPGLTCLLDTLDRLAIGEKMWVQGYAWEVDDGWTSTYTLSGGGLEQPYDPPTGLRDMAQTQAIQAMQAIYEHVDAHVRELLPATPAAEVDSALMIIGDGAAVIGTGIVACWSFDFRARISGWYIQEFDGTTGSVTLALAKAPRGAAPSFVSIVASAPPTISSARYAENATLVGWDDAIDRGTLLRVSVTSASTITRILFGLRIRRLEP